MLRITVLIDNEPSPQEASLHAEHGLSFHIQTETTAYLCDMGASNLFLENASAMGVDLKQVDFAFLSHGHADHSGGLAGYLQHVPDAHVCLSPQVRGKSFYSACRGAKRDISTDETLFVRYSECFCWIENSGWLTENLAIVRNSFHSYPKPAANAFLTVADVNGEVLDDFSHELSLAFVTSQGLVILSSCSHAGALNIIRSCVEFTGVMPHAFVGGLHLVDSHQVEQEVESLCKEIAGCYPGLKIYTGHCTGEMAKQRLKALLPDVHFFHTGMVMDF